MRQPRRGGQPLPRPGEGDRGLARRGDHGEGVVAAAAHPLGQDPQVRIPIASLSGGQRQTVAIARSLRGRAEGGHARRADRGPRRRADRGGPQPDRAAAGDRSRGHPDQPQHGRRPGGRRPHRRAPARPQRRRVQRRRDHDRASSSPPSPAPPTTSSPTASAATRPPTMQEPTMPEATPTTPKNPTTAPTVQDEMSPAVPIAADLSDERLVHARGLRGALDSFTRKVRGGDLGSLPVIIGLIVISLVFYAQEPTFLSSPHPREHHPLRRPHRHHRDRRSCWCCCSARSTCRSARSAAWPRP